MLLAKVYIQFKPGVNDPQGRTILGGLQQLGFDSVAQVRSGKYMEILLEETNSDAAERSVSEMCDRLLANPVIEDFRFEIETGTANPDKS